jgi:hypothetical protein
LPVKPVGVAPEQPVKKRVADRARLRNKAKRRFIGFRDSFKMAFVNLLNGIIPPYFESLTRFLQDKLIHP